MITRQTEALPSNNETRHSAPSHPLGFLTLQQPQQQRLLLLVPNQQVTTSSNENLLKLFLNHS